MLLRNLGVLLVLAVLLTPPALAQKTPITVTASSVITLDLASTTGTASPTPIRGTVRDSGEVPLGDSDVTIRVDGAAVGTTRTGPDGRFATSYVFPALDRVYQVAAEYAGTAAIQGSSTQKSILTVNAQFELAESVNATRGARKELSGRVIVNGNPYAGARVTINLDASPFVANTATDGRFAVTPTIPTGAGPGVHFANYTTTVFVGGAAGRPPTAVTITYQQIVLVRVPGSFVLLNTLPAEWPTGVPVRPQLQLRDGAAQGIGGVLVDMALEGPDGLVTRRLATGVDGRAAFELTPDEDGRYNLTFSVVNPYVTGVANLTKSIRAGELEAEWVGATPEIRKGTTNQSDFAVTFAGQRWTKWRPKLEGAKGAASLSGTAWRVDLEALLTDDVGLRTLRLTFDDVGVTRDLTWKVVSKPTLKLERANVLQNGRSEVTFSVVDEAGKAVPDVPLSATLASAAAGWKTNGTGATGADGKWTWAFTAAVPAGPLVINATGTGVFLQTQASSFTVQARPVSAAWSWLPWLLGAAVLLGAGGAGYVILQRRRAQGAVGPAPEQAAAMLAAHGRSPSLSVALAGVEPGLPAIWGAGEPFAIDLRASGIFDDGEKPLAGAKLALRLEGTTDYPHEVALDGEGRGHAEGLVAAEGECKVHIVYERDDRFDRTELTFVVRLVDYRREIAREFDAFVERASLLAPRLGRSSTPREVQWALEEKLPSDSVSALEDVASVVEHANYSTIPTGRADWLRLVRARQALDTHMPAGRGETAA